MNRAVATIKDVDEYGPIIEWRQHWGELKGQTLYVDDLAQEKAEPVGEFVGSGVIKQYANGKTYPEGTKVYTAPPVERVRVPDEWIDRHQIAAGECPPQSMVVLVSSIRRMISATPSPAIDVEAVRTLLECLEDEHGGDHTEGGCKYCAAWDKLTRDIGDAK